MSESEQNHAGRLGSQFSLYAFGNLFRQLSAIVMVPIYTRYLSVTDYGAIEMVSLIVLFASTTVGMSLGEGIFRQYHAAVDDSGRRRVISTALWQGVAVHTVAALILIALAKPLGDAFVSVTNGSVLLMFFSLTLITETVIAVATCQLRAEGRAVAFFWIGIARLALNIGLNLLLLIVLDMGPLGVILSGLLTTALLAAYLFPRCIRSAGLGFSTTIAKALVVFGVPISLANIVAFYIGAADRFVLEHYAGLAVVGVYGLAVRLAQSVLSLTYDPFEAIWDTEKYRLWIGKERAEPFQRVFRLVLYVLICATLSVGLFSEEIVSVLAPPAFAEAAVVAPILTAAAACNALTRFCRFGTLVGNRTFNITVAAIIAGVFLTLACTLLVPRLVMIGAALAVLATAVVRLVFEERLASRIVNLRLPWIPVFMAACAALVIHVLAMGLPAATLPGVATKIMLIGGFAWLLWRSGYFSAEERAACIAIARARLGYQAQA